MLLAQHALMQNEAILSLTILTRICPTESEELLIETDFGRIMCEFFETRADNLEIHIVLNALSLLNSVVQSGNSRIQSEMKKAFKNYVKVTRRLISEYLFHNYMYIIL